MKPFVLVGSFLVLTAAAWAVAPDTFVRGPKNLMSPTYRPGDAKKLARTAEKASDHIKLCHFLSGRGGKTGRQGSGI